VPAIFSKRMLEKTLLATFAAGWQKLAGEI
jgi:hypothetical protein